MSLPPPSQSVAFVVRDAEVQVYLLDPKLRCVTVHPASPGPLALNATTVVKPEFIATQSAPIVSAQQPSSIAGAHIRAIFSLQEELAQIRPPTACRHLAYIELFTQFRAGPEGDCDLYKVQRSMANFQRAAIVVPLDHIFRSCHLVPDFGHRVERRWKSETVLEQCDIFYLNSFIDPHMYLFVE
ncbi:hypothetical protein PENSPDRAFT_663998 [Peniophora sp. CONT]|nr:hypothetical protein PENSPDRAFT_663998 [Peniophora sp. CONT]